MEERPPLPTATRWDTQKLASSLDVSWFYSWFSLVSLAFPWVSLGFPKFVLKHHLFVVEGCTGKH